MERTIRTFSVLGQRLAGFGKDRQTARIIEQAVEANPWFTSGEIRRAIDAIRTKMLDPDLLRQWAESYPLPVSVPKRILVVMAGNIPLVGFFDLLCVAVSGHHCLIKPSGKDRILTGHIVETLRAIDPKIPLSYYRESEPVDGVIATGSDNANRYFRSLYRGIPSLLRANRQSVAVLSGRETESELAGLSEDIFTYSGLGCRSVSLLFVPPGYRPRIEVPADMNPKYRNNYRQNRALLEMRSIPYDDLGGALMVRERSFPDALSRIHLSEYRTLGEVKRWLERHADRLQCVVTRCFEGSGCIEFGKAQYPALTDYPDHRDVLRFLAGL